MRVELGVLTNGRLGTVEMVSEYIKHEQAEEVNTNKTTFHPESWVRVELGMLTKE